MTMTDLTPVLQRLDALSAQVAYIAERQRAQEEMFAELTPVAREALGTAITKLDELDKRGYFQFAGELAGVAQRIVEGFTPQDVRQLGDAVVGILNTVRALTQPEVLQIASDASAAMQEADEVKPLGIFGMVRATKNDDVQKGMALLVEVLRRIGRGVTAMAEQQQKQLGQKAKLAELLGPRRSRKVLGIERQLPAARTEAARRLARPSEAPAAAPAAAGPACATPKPAVAAVVLDGVEYTADGHLVDANAWSRPLAEALAQVQGVTLTDAHWAVLDAARADFAETQVSPNIRRLTQVAKLTTKDLYALFPKAPGRTIAKIAGLPKPAGCL